MNFSIILRFYSGIRIHIQSARTPAVDNVREERALEIISKNDTTLSLMTFHLSFPLSHSPPIICLSFFLIHFFFFLLLCLLSLLQSLHPNSLSLCSSFYFHKLLPLPFSPALLILLILLSFSSLRLQLLLLLFHAFLFLLLLHLFLVQIIVSSRRS